jgi:predicted membrane protein
MGLAILIFGVLLLLRSVSPELGETLWAYWPVILMLFGAMLISQPSGGRHPILGSTLIIIGFLLILKNVDVIRLRWRDIWPIVFILLGLSIIFRNFRKSSGLITGSDYFDLSLILGGAKYRFDSKNFKGGRITAIMGGGEIDLFDAGMAPGGAEIDVMAIMGGVEIRVPSGWQVSMQGAPILGGMEDKTSTVSGASTDERPRLVIKGTAIMGGVEVKN